MDIGMIRGLGTVVVMVAFVGLALWVFNPRRKKDFDEATRHVEQAKASGSKKQ